MEPISFFITDKYASEVSSKNKAPLSMDDNFEQLVNTFGINNLSQEDSERFKHILEDNKISNGEINNLSYEQVQDLMQFRKIVMKEDGTFVKELMLKTTPLVEALAMTVNISDDQEYNKAVFQTMKESGLPADKIRHEVNDLGGVVDFDKMIKFAQENGYEPVEEGFKDYRSHMDKDMNAFTESLIDRAKSLLEIAAISEKEKDGIRKLIELYEQIQETYLNLKDESNDNKAALEQYTRNQKPSLIESNNIK